MDYYTERLQSELTRILDFWIREMVLKEENSILPEISIDGKGNKDAHMGSMYLSRIIYGASASCNHLKTDRYQFLADTAFKMLYENFRNPAGGFYWARTKSNEVVHDSNNINMAQAFVLYGLSEYAKLTNNPIVENEIKKQYNFIIHTIKDEKEGGFLDGFHVDWKQEKTFSKSLGTHIHLLEAITNIFLLTKDQQYIYQIDELLNLLTEHFIDKNTLECYHQLNMNWSPQQNTNWAGHNLEVSWILHKSAQAIEDRSKIELTGQLAVDMTKRALENAFDKDYGGIFNTLIDEKPADEAKEWWPQAEAAIASFNAFQVSGDKYFLSYGLRLIEYIENTFSDVANGEWYSAVTKEGQPLQGPKIHFWKSLYHNTRYCIELVSRIKEISSPYMI